jgi:hypothetical protein
MNFICNSGCQIQSLTTEMVIATEQISGILKTKVGVIDEAMRLVVWHNRIGA